MASGEKSTIQTILENVRGAGVAFGHRFAPPADERAAITDLLKQLGINDPLGSVTTQLASVAAAWRSIADTLSGVSLDFTDPAALLAGIAGKADAIKNAIDAILRAPNNALNGLGASGAAIKAVLPKRLLDFIVYEFITSTHPRIAGMFLLLGVLRKEFTPAGGNAAFIDAELRLFDLAQFVKSITHPKESFLTVMHWGDDQFLDRTILDGLGLLLKTIPSVQLITPDEFPLADEKKFVTVTPGVRPAARQTISAGGVNLSFVGLHKHGIGLVLKNPVHIGTNIIPTPTLPEASIFAIVPGPNPVTSNPEFAVLP